MISNFKDYNGNVNLRSKKSVRWVFFPNEKSFDSHGCLQPKSLSKYTIERYGNRSVSEYQNQNG